MKTITTAIWWKAALIRAVRTALVVAVPYFGTAALFADVPWVTVGSAAALGFVLSLVTSLAGIAEASGATVPTWLAMLERVVKTVAQALVAGIGNALLFQDVSWPSILQAALIAGFGSLLLGVTLKLPEAIDAGTAGADAAVITTLPPISADPVTTDAPSGVAFAPINAAGVAGPLITDPTTPAPDEPKHLAE